MKNLQPPYHYALRHAWLRDHRRTGHHPRLWTCGIHPLRCESGNVRAWRHPSLHAPGHVELAVGYLFRLRGHAAHGLRAHDGGHDAGQGRVRAGRDETGRRQHLRKPAALV